MAELRSALDDACGGRGRLFLLTGPPGIGKTRLADEVATHAASSAMAVLRAGCWEGAGAPAYWPFIQVVRSALGGIDQDDDALLKLPSLRNDPRMAQDPAHSSPTLTPGPRHLHSHSHSRRSILSRHASGCSTRSPAVVRDMAGLRPLMLILEDLHDADQPSLLMLRFVVGQLRNAPVLMLCTYRDVEVQRSPVLSRLIGDLTREGIQVPLFALSREDAARMIEERGRRAAQPQVGIGYSSGDGR